MQTKYLRQLKETILTSKCIVVGKLLLCRSRCSSRVSLGKNTQATLHPFIVYYRSEADGTLSSESHCMISDSTRHTTSTVYTFQKSLLESLKAQHPNIHYISDGCARQYKNHHNFINLCFHQEDVGLLAEWNFFRDLTWYDSL